MDIERKARQNVKRKAQFRKSLGSFLTTAAIFIVISFFIPSVARWLFLALGIWGISLVGKYFSIRKKQKDADWEVNEYRKEIRKLREQSESSKYDYNLEDLEDMPDPNPKEKQRPWNEEDLV